MVNVVVSCYAPYGTVCLPVNGRLSVSALGRAFSVLCPHEEIVLQSAGGGTLDDSVSLDHISGGQDLFLRLSPRMLGGKGGFASQLRAQGGRMNHNKSQNKSSCRDLSGRRLSTIKEAEALAKHLADEPNRELKEKKEKEEKLKRLRDEIKRLDEEINNEPSGAKRRLEDTEYIRESEAVTENVKSAVQMALLKRRKKNKTGAAVKADVKGTKTGAKVAEVKVAEMNASETKTVAPV